jgi:glycosidase
MTAVEHAADGIPSQRWASFLTNHDQPRVMTVLGGNVDEAKIAATALLTLPGIPFVYYGEEIGMSGNKPDERIRTPMQWADEPGGGFTTATPWEPFQEDWATLNVAAQTDDADSLLNHYRQLIHLHVAHPALSHGAFIPLDTGQRSVVAFVRQSDDETILVLLNFGREAADAVPLTGTAGDLPPGTYDLRPLLGDQPGAPLIVGADGAITNFVPLPTLAPLTGYVFDLAPAP